MPKLVLLRHGQSTWNESNRFTGWTDVDLTPRGVREAESSARLLKQEGVKLVNGKVDENCFHRFN